MYKVLLVTLAVVLQLRADVVEVDSTVEIESTAAADSVDSADSMESVDSMESADSMDAIGSVEEEASLEEEDEEEYGDDEDFEEEEFAFDEELEMGGVSDAEEEFAAEEGLEDEAYTEDLGDDFATDSDYVAYMEKMMSAVSGGADAGLVEDAVSEAVLVSEGAVGETALVDTIPEESAETIAPEEATTELGGTV